MVIAGQMLLMAEISELELDSWEGGPEADLKISPTDGHTGLLVSQV